MLYQTQCGARLGIEMLTEIKHMTQLGKNASQGAFWIRNTISKAGSICWFGTHKLETGKKMSQRKGDVKKTSLSDGHHYCLSARVQSRRSCTSEHEPSDLHDPERGSQGRKIIIS